MRHGNEGSRQLRKQHLPPYTKGVATELTSLLLAIFAAVAAASPALGQVRYNAVALGPGTTAAGINAAGHVAGHVSEPDGRRAFLWREGAMQFLGTLGGANSVATAVNDRGEVAGYAETADGRTRAFLWRDGHMQDLGTLPGHADSYASGLNNAGWVVGISKAPGAAGQQRAFLHDGSAMRDLGTLGGANSSALAVNDAGQVVGEADAADRTRQAFLYASGMMLDLGDRGATATNSAAVAINGSGHVAGYQNRTPTGVPGGVTDVWFHAEGRKIAVTCGSGRRCFPSGLNDAGRMVGSWQVSVLPFDYIGAFVWDVARGSDVVQARGWRVMSAAAINARRQIAAQGCNEQGCQGLRLDPLSEPRVVEYFHAGFGHYFITALDAEIALLDTMPGAGWVRTDRTFYVFGEGPAPRLPVCRFWSDQSFAPKSSHFYSPYAHECELLKQGTVWRHEGDVFHLRLPEGPPESRRCPPDTQALYRAYNNGLSGAPNHRYTIDPALLDQMIAQGWTMEGQGNERVFACVPLQE